MSSPQKRRPRIRSNSTSSIGSTRRASFHNGAVQGLSNSLDSQRFSVMKVSNGKAMKKKKDFTRLRQTNNCSPVDSPLASARGEAAFHLLCLEPDRLLTCGMLGSVDYLPSPVPFSPTTRHKQQRQNYFEDEQHAADLHHALNLAGSDATQDGATPDSAVGRSFSGSIGARRTSASAPYLGQAPELTRDSFIASMPFPLDESVLSDSGALDVSMGVQPQHTPDISTPFILSDQDTTNPVALGDRDTTHYMLHEADDDDTCNDVFVHFVAPEAMSGSTVVPRCTTAPPASVSAFSELPRPLPNLRGVPLARSASVPSEYRPTAADLLAAGPLRQTNRQGSLDGEPFRAASSEG